MKIITIFLVLVINSLLLVWLLGGCGSSSSPSSHGSWTVTMTGFDSGSITFSNGLFPSQNIITDGSGSFPGSTGNIFVAAGNSAGGPCQLFGPESIMIGNSVGSATIPFAGNCTDALTSNLQIGLGNSTAGVLDKNSNFIVTAGSSTVCTIVAPGNTGSSCTVNY